MIDHIEGDGPGKSWVEEWDDEDGEESGEEGVVDGDEEDGVPDEVGCGGQSDDLQVTLDKSFIVIDLFLIPRLMPLSLIMVILLPFSLH